MGWIWQWWQKWAGCAGWHHEPASLQTCVATKSLTMDKSHLPEQLCPGPRKCPAPHSPSHVGFPGEPGRGSHGPCLPWGLLGLGPWYGACWVDCVLSSQHVGVTLTIQQPSTMPLILSIDSSFCYGHYSLIQLQWHPWHHWTLPASAWKLPTLSLLLQN